MRSIWNRDAQVAAKQRILGTTLRASAGRARNHPAADPHGMPWEHHASARLSVRRNEEGTKTLVGFHESAAASLADMSHCEIPTARIYKIDPAAGLADRWPFDPRGACHLQIEVACSDNVDIAGAAHHGAAHRGDETALLAFADTHAISLQLQTKGRRRPRRSIHRLRRRLHL